MLIYYVIIASNKQKKCYDEKVSLVVQAVTEITRIWFEFNHKDPGPKTKRSNHFQVNSSVLYFICVLALLASTRLALFYLVSKISQS